MQGVLALKAYVLWRVRRQGRRHGGAHAVGRARRRVLRGAGSLVRPYWDLCAAGRRRAQALCVLPSQGREDTFAFIEAVLTEVLEMFPSKLIHIGGDEVGSIACVHLLKSLSAVWQRAILTGQRKRHVP